MIKEWRSLLITTIVLVLAISISARPGYDAPAAAAPKADSPAASPPADAAPAPKADGPAASPPADAAPAPSPPKDEAPPAPKDAGPPAGALPHPVVQSPEHVNEPKVMTGEQHPSGNAPYYEYKPPVYTTVYTTTTTTTTTTYTTTTTTTTPYTSKMTYGTFYTYKNFPVKTTTPYRVPKYEEIPNKYDPFMPPGVKPSPKYETTSVVPYYPIKLKPPINAEWKPPGYVPPDPHVPIKPGLPYQ